MSGRLSGRCSAHDDERGIAGAVHIDRAVIEEQTCEVYDIVELEGRCHVFYR